MAFDRSLRPVYKPQFAQISRPGTETETDTRSNSTVTEKALRTVIAPSLSSVSAIIGGDTAYLPPHSTDFNNLTKWPTCLNCETPLVPLIQLNVNSEGTPPELAALIPSAQTPTSLTAFRAPGITENRDIKDADNGEGFFEQAKAHTADGPSESSQQLITVLQVFICPSREWSCYQDSTTFGTPNPSFLTRIIRVPQIDLASDTGSRYAQVYPGRQKDSLSAKYIHSWVHTRDEVEHCEINWVDLYEENEETDNAKFYRQHEPLEGWKLLGYAVRGEFDGDRALTLETLP